MDFKAGDVVRVKGTDVKMTIHSVSSKYITCIWFDKDNHFQRLGFATEILEPCTKV